MNDSPTHASEGSADEATRRGGAEERSSGGEIGRGARGNGAPSEPLRPPLARLRRLRESLKELAARTDADGAHSVGEAVREADRLLRELESSEHVAVEEGALRSLRQLLRREQRRYWELQDFAAVAFLLTDAEGRIREANRRAGELLGESAGRLRGRKIEDFVPEGRREELGRRLEEIRASGERTRFRCSVEAPGETPVPVGVVGERLGAPSEDRSPRIRWSLRDATERQRAEQTVSVLRRQQEERAEAERAARRSALLAEVTGLLSRAPLRYRDALGEVARLIVEVSHADHCAVWLREGGELERVGAALTEDGPVRLPVRFREDFGLDGASAAETVGRVLESAEVWQLSESAGGADGSRRVERHEEASGVCRGLLVPISAGGAPLGILGLFDLGVGPGFDDEEIAFARELAERTALGVENARLYAEAKRAMRERDSVQSMASHDLRNGLTNLALALDDLRHTLPDDAELREGLDRAERSLERMTGLIDDLDPSVEEHPDRLRREPVDLEALARDVLATHEVAADRKQLVLELESDAELPPVTADPERMRQILDNLVQNGVKFTPPGGDLAVHLSRKGASVAVSVLDSGPGLPSANPHRIFDRFWRGEEVSGVQGTGLGLSIVKTLVHAHGGRISARDREEGGAEITFTLPLETAARGGEPPDGPESPTRP